MKVRYGQVISFILVSSILVSSLIIVTEEAMWFMSYIKSSYRNFENNTDVLIDYEDGDLNRLRVQLETMNVTLLNKLIRDYSRMHSDIQILLELSSIIPDRDVELDKRTEFLLFTCFKEAKYLYEKCIKYLKIEAFDETVCTFAQSVTSNTEDGLDSLLERIQEKVLPKKKQKSLIQYRDFFSSLKDHFKRYKAEHCGKVSLQQKVYGYCEILIQNEKIAFLVYKLSYQILSQCSQGNYTGEMELAIGGIVRRIWNYRQFISKIITDLPREVRPCDPWRYKQNENFFELERVVRLIPINEMQLSPSHNCMSTCSNISIEPLLGMTLYSNYTINMTYCDSCESAESSLLCRAPVDNRRYDAAAITFKRALEPIRSLHGELSWCNGTHSNETKPYSMSDFGNYCDNCVCKCTNPDVDIKWRYAISLRPQESNISENMVVTGIRFYKTNNIDGVKVIYPQIKVAKLLPEELSEGFWKDVGNFDNGLWPSGEAGVDYAILGKDENQSMIFNLDKNIGKPGYVVTGVKFQLRYDRYREKRYARDDSKSLEIVLRMTKCNFVTGSLSVSESSYTDPDAVVTSTLNEDVKLKTLSRTRLEILDEFVKVDPYNSTFNPKSRQYLEISHSSKEKDFGQSTLPRFDLLPVDPTPALPLSGINLFYKRADSSGGYIAFKVTTVSKTDFLGF